MRTLVITRRRFNAMAALAFAGRVSPALAQDWPARSIECVVGYAPGGGVDLLIRTLAPGLSSRLGQPLVVVNRAGASGILGAQAVARARPDGYTLYAADGGALALNGALFSQLPYDPEKDFAPVALLIRSPLIVVAHPSFPANGLRALVDLARRDGKLSYASVGIGSYHHMAMELLKQNAGFAAQAIPYKGQGPAVQDVVSGQVPLMVIGAAGLPQVISGKLKALAVLSHERIAALPRVLTVSEQGVSDAEVHAWVGLVAPRESPHAVIGRLGDELRTILALPEMTKRLDAMGYEPHYLGQEEFGRFIAAEIRRFHPLIRSLNIKLDT